MRWPIERDVVAVTFCRLQLGTDCSTLALFSGPSSASSLRFSGSFCRCLMFYTRATPSTPSSTPLRPRFAKTMSHPDLASRFDASTRNSSQFVHGRELLS